MNGLTLYYLTIVCLEESMYNICVHTPIQKDVKNNLRGIKFDFFLRRDVEKTQFVW